MLKILRKIGVLSGLILGLGTVSEANNFDKVTGPDQIPVIMYHHISTNSKDWGSASISPGKFKSDMLAIKKAGYTTVLPTDVIDFKSGKKSLPGKPIMITFDDGYYSNYEYAFPVLKELNMKATIHVIGDYRGRTPGYVRHFSWGEAKEMYDSGLVSIQAHTNDLHYTEDKAKGKGTGVKRFEGESIEAHKRRVKKDLIKNIKDIENNVGEKVVVFAYPFGAKESYSDELLKELGFKMSFTVNKDVTRLNEGTFSMPRVNMPHTTSSNDLVKEINNLKLKNVKLLKNRNYR